MSTFNNSNVCNFYGSDLWSVISAVQIKGMQIKTIKRYYSHHSAGKNLKVWWYQVFDRTWTNSISYTLLVGAKPLQPYWETICHYIVKLNIHRPKPSNSRLRFLSRRDLHRKHEQESLWQYSSLWWKRVISSLMEHYTAVKNERTTATLNRDKS